MVDNRAKEAILDLSKYFNRPVRVELSGGRKGIGLFKGIIGSSHDVCLVCGILKGFDQINNLVLDNAREEKGILGRVSFRIAFT